MNYPIRQCFTREQIAASRLRQKSIAYAMKIRNAAERLKDFEGAAYWNEVVMLALLGKWTIDTNAPR